MKRFAIGCAVLALTAVGSVAVAQQTVPQTAQAPSNNAIASAQYSQDPELRCDLLEVKRVSGGALLVRWRVINTGGGGSSGLTATAAKPIRYNFDWNELFFIDPAENKKYQFLTDSGGNRILDVWYGDLAPGQQRVNWAKFPAPPASSTKISLALPKFPPFEDVPVSQ
jgi:hypothetical protein